jgi:protein TonB
MNKENKVINSKFFALAASGFVHFVLLAFIIYSYKPTEVQAYQTIQISMIATSKAPQAEPVKKAVQQKTPVKENGMLKAPQAEPEKVTEPKQELAKLEPESGKAQISDTEQDVVVSEPSFSANYLRNPAPKYPESARRKRQQGSVLLKVVVSPAGEPANILLQASSGSELLDNAAIDAVARWKFVPAKRNDEFVTASVIVPIDFKLE